MAPVLKILGVPRLPPGGSLGTGKRGTVPKIWRAVPIFLARVNGVLKTVNSRGSNFITLVPSLSWCHILVGFSGDKF